MSISNTPSYSLKTVSRGEPDWTTLTALLERKVDPLKSEQLSKMIEKYSKLYHCQLLYCQNEPVGVLIYQTMQTSLYAQYGYPHALQISALYGTNESQQRFLLREVVRVVRAQSGQSLYTRVSEVADEMILFLSENHFVSVEDCIYARRVVVPMSPLRITRRREFL